MKVKCNVCDHEINGFCKIKKVYTKLNKSRQCDSYKFNSTKVKEYVPIHTELRPDWYWNRKELINKAKKEFREAQKINPNYNPMARGSIAPNGTMAHPLTGDLSRFTSTSSKEIESND